MRAACVQRVQSEPAASQFSKHSLLTDYALGPACGGLRRPAVVSMRSYVRNTKSADAVVPMVLDKPTPASAATVQMSGSGTTLSSFALSRQELGMRVSRIGNWSQDFFELPEFRQTIWSSEIAS